MPNRMAAKEVPTTGKTAVLFVPTRDSRCDYCLDRIDPVMHCELPRRTELVEDELVNEDGIFCGLGCHRGFITEIKPLEGAAREAALQAVERERVAREGLYGGDAALLAMLPRSAVTTARAAA